MEFELKLPKTQNIVWIPSEVVASLGRKLRLVPGSMSAVLYSEGADLRTVCQSLRIIIQDLELRPAGNQSEAVSNKEENPVA